MALNLKIFLILLSLFGFISIFKMIKAKHLSMKFGMYWTIVFIFLMLLIIFPNIIESLAHFLGFKEAPNLLFLIAIFLLFYIVFALYTTISKLQEMNRRLVQELSLLKHDLKKK